MASCFDLEPGRSTIKLQGTLATNATATTSTTITMAAAVLLVKESFFCRCRGNASRGVGSRDR